MPYQDPDSTDPMTLTGVELAVDDPGSVREMAECFIEEYLRLGHSAASIEQMFESRQFAGPTLAVIQLGMKVIREMIQQQFLLRGPRSARLQVDRDSGGAVNLPVL